MEKRREERKGKWRKERREGRRGKKRGKELEKDIRDGQRGEEERGGGGGGAAQCILFCSAGGSFCRPGRGSKAGSVLYRICVSVELRVVRSNVLLRIVVVVVFFSLIFGAQLPWYYVHLKSLKFPLYYRFLLAAFPPSRLFFRLAFFYDETFILYSPEQTVFFI